MKKRHHNLSKAVLNKQNGAISAPSHRSQFRTAPVEPVGDSPRPSTASQPDHPWDGDDVRPRAEYLASLPRRRIAAAALIRDEAGRVCLVDPTYQELWSLPGGTVEADESPSAGCRREVLEELGLRIDLGRMLCMD